jgi:hypothetical protein
MTGSITHIEQLEKWFRAANLPFFSLKYAGTGEKTIFRNETWEDMEDAWEQLKTHPLRTNIDIRQGAYPAQAGIGGMPYPGVGDISGYVAQQVELAMLRRDNEELQQQIENPVSGWERIIDKIGQSPHLAGIAQMLVASLVPKATTVAQGVPATVVAGTPDAENEDGYPDTMYENLEATAAALNTTPEKMVEKMAELARKNPEIARTLIAP